MSPIFTLDFEASCLPQHGRSFPIEVGIAGPDGLTRSWLIRPEPQWRSWTWTAEAETLHGLTWNQLCESGAPPARVFNELTDLLRGRPVFADSYFDAGWMRTLAVAAGAPPLIEVRHIDALIDALQLSEEAVKGAVTEARRQSVRRHRAAEDARWLQGLARRLVQLAGVEADMDRDGSAAA